MPAPVPTEIQELADRLAEAVAGAFVRAAGPLDPAIRHVELGVYWDGDSSYQWAPVAEAITYDGAIGLPWPDVLGDPALREPGDTLLAYVNEHEAMTLVGGYFRALAERLGAAWGVPVRAHDPDGGITER